MRTNTKKQEIVIGAEGEIDLKKAFPDIELNGSEALELTKADIITLTLSRLRNIRSLPVDKETVVVKGTPETIQKVRESLAELGLMEMGASVVAQSTDPQIRDEQPTMRESQHQETPMPEILPNATLAYLMAEGVFKAGEAA